MQNIKYTSHLKIKIYIFNNLSNLIIQYFKIDIIKIKIRHLAVLDILIPPESILYLTLHFYEGNDQIFQ